MPWPNLSSFQAALATASASNSSEDLRQAINAFSSYINKHGGINCRMLKVITPEYDPGDEFGSMASVCKQYTKDHKVFAWIDGIGAWHDSGQLCVAHDGNTPLITNSTGTTQTFQSGQPNLWWTGPDMCNVLRNLVHWSVATGQLTKSTRFGVVYSTSNTDVDGYRQCLLPALKREGLKPTDTGQLTYSTQPNQSQAQAAAISSRFHAPPDSITTVIPMLPFFQFESWLTGSSGQHYAPKLLMSDYDSMFQIALTLVGESGSGNQPFPTPFTQQLQNQQGPTFFVLGNADAPPYASPLGKFCDDAWHATYPPKSDNPHIEATGTAMTTCQNLELFATAATMAGNNLTRATFNAAMKRVTNFNGGVVPNLRFGSGFWSGPHLVRIVSVHNNTDDACPKKHNQKQGTYNQGNCWLIKSGWSEEQLA
jgi:ABC-type branched-subunit amino acid transport system substrate-binding protein